MRISDWSSDVCSSDLEPHESRGPAIAFKEQVRVPLQASTTTSRAGTTARKRRRTSGHERVDVDPSPVIFGIAMRQRRPRLIRRENNLGRQLAAKRTRSEEHTSELQSLMRTSYA